MVWCFRGHADTIDTCTCVLQCLPPCRLQRLHERLSTALQTPSDPDPPTWPGARALLQLSLFTTLFPTSDKRHPVVTPLSLLTAKYLSQCTAVTVNEAAVGLLLCSLLLGIAESGETWYTYGRILHMPLSCDYGTCLEGGGGSVAVARRCRSHVMVSGSVQVVVTVPSLSTT